MSKISLEKFIENTKGTKVDVPWESDGHLKGQCVSLIQSYIEQCLEQPAHARGHATGWVTSYVNEGLGYTVADQRKGDIIVFPNEADGYGHIAIYIDENTLYDQNNLRHDNGNAGYGNIFSWDFVTLRPNAELLEEVKEKLQQPQVNKQMLYLPADAESWRVYPMDKQPIVGNECGKLLPSKFGGLEYEILGWTMPDVAIIQTRDFGKVQIYVAPSTGAIIV